MTAFTRLIEKWFEIIVDRNVNSKMGSRIVRIFLVLILLSVSAGVMYLKINYNLSLGPR